MSYRDYYREYKGSTVGSIPSFPMYYEASARLKLRVGLKPIQVQLGRAGQGGGFHELALVQIGPLWSWFNVMRPVAARSVQAILVQPEELSVF